MKWAGAGRVATAALAPGSRARVVAARCERRWRKHPQDNDGHRPPLQSDGHRPPLQSDGSFSAYEAGGRAARGGAPRRAVAVAVVVGVLLVAGWVAAPRCRAGALEWEARRVEVAGLRSDRYLEGRFACVNRGERPVKILSAKTTCGCTVATPDRRLIAPGERCELAVRYTVGRKLGYYEAPVTVKTDDPEEREVRLAFRLRVRDVLEISPTLVYWRAGEPLAPKEIAVVAGDGQPFAAVRATAEDARVAVRVEEVRPGLEYRLIVTPAATFAGGRTTVAVTAERGGVEVGSARAHVRGP